MFEETCWIFKVNRVAESRHGKYSRAALYVLLFSSFIVHFDACLLSLIPLGFPFLQHILFSLSTFLHSGVSHEHGDFLAIDSPVNRTKPNSWGENRFVLQLLLARCLFFMKTVKRIVCLRPSSGHTTFTFSYWTHAALFTADILFILDCMTSFKTIQLLIRHVGTTALKITKNPFLREGNSLTYFFKIQLLINFLFNFASYRATIRSESS